MLKQGLVQVYTGGSGAFNFAPIGLSLRAVGQNLRPLIACFEMHEKMESALMVAHILRPQLIIDHSPLESDATEGDPSLHAHAFQRARDAAVSGAFDLVILNGIHAPLARNTISLEEVLSLMAEKHPQVELVLAGTDLPEVFVEQADLVTEMVVDTGSEPAAGSGGAAAPIEVVTGDGKGKTTYCLGKALLMSCEGIRSTILQFMKSPQAYGEVKAIDRAPFLEIHTMGEGFLHPDAGAGLNKHRQAARLAWEECLREIFSLKYGLIVLDEINTATYYGLVNGERVREMLFLKPRDLHLLLSGRNAHLQVMEAASVVIEMREIKHPFARGVSARKGIEY